MAITQCSDCGGTVSTKAEACPHCGSPVEPQQSQITCLDCGEAFEASLTACPVCGGPNEEHEVVVEKQARMEEAKKKWDRHKRLYLSSIIALVLVLGVGATYLVRSAQERAAEEAAEALKVTASDLKELGICDRIIEEPLGGAHRNRDEVVQSVKNVIVEELQLLTNFTPEELIKQRHEKYDSIGLWQEGT